MMRVVFFFSLLFRFGFEKGSKIVLRFTHVVEQLSFFSMFPTILTFDFDLILG